MKRFARWLSDITGATKDIEREIRRDIGERLLQESYWFNGGIMYKEPINNVQNFMVLYGEKLKQNICPNISSIRDDIYRAEKEGLNLNIDREVYGYWDNKICYFIPAEKLEKELRDPQSPVYGKKLTDLEQRMRIKWKDCYSTAHRKILEYY